MDNIGKEYKNILNNIEERLKDNPELEYVKSEFTNLFMLFFNEIDSLRQLYEDKIETILDRQSYFDEKISKLEETTKTLEKELFSDEEIEDEELRKMMNMHGNGFGIYEDEECEVTCPYCNEPFYIDTENVDNEVKCPHCNNLIELDWNDESMDNQNLYNKNNENNIDDDM